MRVLPSVPLPKKRRYRTVSTRLIWSCMAVKLKTGLTCWAALMRSVRALAAVVMEMVGSVKWRPWRQRCAC